ncbi:CvpA family protein [Singulisphaera sp. PoT]|uniref:CvpA family protein n=1 Tax=Singulisphaera sp. PoT TaxID=3411797 RepID=UPI003BF4A9CA
MGLDLALGGLVLIMAIRGYLKGFVLQAIRLVGLVCSVYAADPIRNYAKPHILPSLPSLQPDLLERGLWWGSAIITYLVLVGLCTLAVKLYRRQSTGVEESNRNDQMAGALLGLAKGLIVAAFVANGFQTHAIEHIKNIPWALSQAEKSKVLVWNEKYKPAPKIWASPPVKMFVAHIKKMGFGNHGEPAEDKPAVQTASRTPQLQWSAGKAEGADNGDLDSELTEAVKSVEEALRTSRADASK